jgi:phage recombination protein Bet
MEQNGLIKTDIDFTNREIVATLKQTVAQGLSDPEFALFAEHCKGTGLNPFKKEVWAIKAGGRLQVMTGINGYWQIANRHPQFDGAETGMINKAGEWVKSVPGNDFLGAWCRVYRKDRKIAMEGEAFLSDYQKNTPIWTQTPRIMIKKVAESIALRKAFPQELNGTYTEEEMPVTYAASKAEPVVVPAEVIAREEPPKMICQYDISDLAPEKREAAIALLRKAGAVTDDDLLLYWDSPIEIKKLANYKVGEESAS